MRGKVRLAKAGRLESKVGMKSRDFNTVSDPKAVCGRVFWNAVLLVG